MCSVKGDEKKFDQKQYDLLIECAKKGAMTEWNKWYEGYLNEQMEYCKSRGVQLENTILKCNDMDGVDLSDTNLRGVSMIWILLTGANLEGADLRETKLMGSWLNGANLKNADLRESDLRMVNLTDAKLNNANLKNADLSGSDLRMANLTDAKLNNANLSGVDLSGANMYKTNFRFARVDGNTLIVGDPDKIIDDDTDFTGVGLSEARIDPKLRTRLERNIRKKQWEKQYVKPRVYPFHAALIEKWNRIRGGNSAESPKTSDTAPAEPQMPKTESNRLTWKQWLKNIFRDIPIETFWWLSDYGSKTTRILLAFLGLNLIFTTLYLWVVPYLPTIRQGATPMFAELMYNTSTVDPVAALIQSNMIVFSIADVATSNLDYIPMFLILVHIVLGYVILAALVTRFAIMFQSLSP